MALIATVSSDLEKIIYLWDHLSLCRQSKKTLSQSDQCDCMKNALSFFSSLMMKIHEKW